MTNQEEQLLDMVENQIEHVIALCQSYVEADQLEDVGNIRALYEEYGEWIDLYTEKVEGEYTIVSIPAL